MHSDQLLVLQKTRLLSHPWIFECDFINALVTLYYLKFRNTLTTILKYTKSISEKKQHYLAKSAELNTKWSTYSLFAILINLHKYEINNATNYAIRDSEYFLYQRTSVNNGRKFLAISDLTSYSLIVSPFSKLKVRVFEVDVVYEYSFMPFSRLCSG